MNIDKEQYFADLKARQPDFTTERHEIEQQFVDEINKSNKKDGFKELSPAFVAIKMGKLDLHKLKIFLAKCRSSKSFSATWWTDLKKKTKK